MTEVKDGQTDSVAAPEEELSDADLDAALSEEDPDFAKTIKDIGKDKSLSMADIELSEGEQAIFDERALWENGSKFTKKVVKIFPLIIYVSLVTKKLKYKIASLFLGIWIGVKNFTYDLLKVAKKKVIESAKTGFNRQKTKLVNFKDNFKYMPGKLKFAFFGLVTLVAVTSFVIYRISTNKGIVPTNFELFIPSMERYATEVVIYDPKTETEPFYENLRAAGQIVLMPKMLVNLRPSKNSGPNPMAAFEFFLEGMSPEVAVEVKDREIEVRDRSARALEEFSFDLAESAEGKKQICDKLRRELNVILQRGKIKRVWIKTIVLKP